MNERNETEKICNLQKEEIVGHLPNEKTEKFAKMIIYFLKSEKLCFCKVKATGKIFNLGYSKEMIIPVYSSSQDLKRTLKNFQKLLKDCK